jgi:hypothetical protein
MDTLVVGATGLVGSDVCSRLREAGHHVRALVRRTSDPAKRQALEQRGVELIYGDLKDPESLVPACAGIDAVISTASSTLSRQAGDGMIALTTRDSAHSVASLEKRACRISYSCLSGKTGDALSQRDVIQMIEVAGGGPITTEGVSETDLEAQRRAATDPMQQSFAGLMLQCAQGDAIDPSRSRELLPFARTSVHQYIAAQIAPTGSPAGRG